jgi:drug/metabolite transporter (DMT)-like permease
MFNPAGFDWNDHLALLGNAYLLAGAFAWAISILHVRAHRWRQSALVLAPWQMLVGLVPTIFLAVLWESHQPIHWTPSLVAVLAFNGPIATAFAVWAWISVNRGLPAIVSSMGSLGVPVAGAIFSILMLGESITVENATGLALLTLGLALVSLEAARER